MPPTRTSITALAVAMVSITLAACGAGQRNTNPQPGNGAERQREFLTTHKLDLLLGDCGSYRPITETLVPTMVTIAENSAQGGRAFWAGCLDGAPLRSLVWKPKVDFGDLPASTPGAQQVNEARALGLQGKLETMVRTTRARVPGSGLLEALELACQTGPDVGRVFMITGGQVDQSDGVNLGTASPADIRQTIKRWTHRLYGCFKGAQLWFIGAGQGAPSTRSVRNAEALFDGIADNLSTSFTWARSLPAYFPTPSSS